MITYMEYMVANERLIRFGINDIQIRFSVFAVGNGFIDLITPIDRCRPFLDALSDLLVAVCGVSWWCHCIEDKPKTSGCPHGYGGPRNPFGEGWFSECSQFPMLDVLRHVTHHEGLSAEEVVRQCNQTVREYLEVTLTKESFYSPCLTPGMWLHVPSDWKRE